MIIKRENEIPFSPAGFSKIDQSFLALFACGPLLLTSANISSLSIGLEFFLIGRFDRKSVSSSSNGNNEAFVGAFDVYNEIYIFLIMKN
jgi:hypothetical protein